MDLLKRSLWRVPLICLVTGIFWLQCEVQLLLWLAVEKQADGTVTTDPGGELLAYSIGLAAVLLLGGMLLLRKQSRWDIFYSASIIVVYRVVLVLAQSLSGITTGPGAVIFMKLYAPLEWTQFPAILLHTLFPNAGANSCWAHIFSLPCYLMPYLFCLFGKRASGNVETGM